MINRFTCLMIAATAFAASLPSGVSAQTGAGRTPKFERRTSVQTAKVQPEPIGKLIPGPRIKNWEQIKSPFKVKGQVFEHPQTVKPAARLAAGAFIPSAYGIITGTSTQPADSLPFLASFQLQSPFLPVKTGSKLTYYPNYGSTIADGKLTGVYFDTRYASYGHILNYLVSYDLETGALLSQDDLGDSYNLVAVETGTDPTDGSVFGEFYNATMSGLEYGIADYSTKKRTTIASAKKVMVAIGVDKSGQPYGIATDGNLYKIDKVSGAETLIGSTGVQLVDHEGSFFLQSGEIDPQTNKFYWAAVDSAGNSALYTVNLQNAALTEVASGDYHIAALNIPAQHAEAGVPDVATDITASFTDANTTGTVAFTAPSTTFGGSALTGSLNYTITANGSQVATGTTTAGATTTAGVTLEEGLNNIVVTTSNAAGTSPASRLTAYIGYDQPEAPTDVTLSIDGQNKATVTWTAPSKTVHNGYLGQLKYDVFRYTKTDTVKVATDQTATTFTEQLTAGALTNYSYGVQAKNGTQASPVVTSNGETLGNGYEVPYLAQFNDQSDLDNFTIIDANNDTHTWAYFTSYSSHGVRYRWDNNNTGDDWLITPPVHLKAGNTYNVAYKVKSYNTRYTERIEAKWGEGNTVASMTNELTPATDVATPDWEVLTKQITPAADGNYNFGFHAISAANQYYLYIDSISITQAMDAASPDSVTNLKATADPTGALKVTLSFNAPSLSTNGQALSSLDSIEIRKGNDIIGSLKPVTPGSAQTFVDENASAGANSYTVIAVNAQGAGRPATVTATAGPDTPAAPQVTATDNITSVHFTWPTVKGANGGIIIPSEVSYEIHNINAQGYVADSLTTIQGGNEYTINLNTTEGEQDYKSWAFRAINKTGRSRWSSATVIVGAPYPIPFSNSFANGTAENQFFGITLGTNSVVRWNVSSESSDNDKGSIQFANTGTYGSYVGQSTLSTGKISLAGAQHPKFVFSYKGQANADSRLVAELQHQNGQVDSLWSTAFTTDDGSWKKVNIDLPSAVASEPYVIMRFRGVANTDDATTINVDNIHVADPLQNDAAINVTAPESLVKGQTASIVATLSNEGLSDLAGLEVKISVNNEVVADTTIARTLTSFDKLSIPVSYKTSSTDDASALSIKAEVINANDLDESNNTATAAVTLSQADVNAPTDLKTTADGNLTWTAPAAMAQTVTDDFERYTPWATSNVGDWTFVNGDGAKFGPMTNDNAEPNIGADAAYEVWRPSDVFDSGYGVDAHSGSQCLASIYKSNDGGQTVVNADDWLISPELSGNAQTISYWINNLNGEDDYYGTTYGTEIFQILASSTDKDTASFTQVGSTLWQYTGEWTKFTSNLPAGSKYFAIRRITDSSEEFAFFVDDISYEANMTASSYNIYIDGKLAGNTTGTTFPGKSDGANHSYSVTAVYADGSESAPVSIDVVANGINDIHTQFNADKYDVFTLGGAQVKLGAKSLNGLATGVYVINGKKVLVK